MTIDDEAKNWIKLNGRNITVTQPQPEHRKPWLIIVTAKKGQKE